MRFVIDTNLLVSAVISAGLPRQLLDAARAGEFELCTSEVLLAELLDVLGRGKFANRLTQAGLSPQTLVDDLRRLAVVVAPTNAPRVVPTDPDDDDVQAAALARRGRPDRLGRPARPAAAGQLCGHSHRHRTRGLGAARAAAAVAPSRARSAAKNGYGKDAG